jgi:colanic acid biosynthesis glycosyl transferase WcaI
MTRYLIHDYAGHPFQVQLSRELAERGNDVLHVTFAGIQTPRGELALRHGDPSTLAFFAVRLDESFDKHSLVHRLRQERAVARQTAQLVRSFRPEVVLSGNAPLDVQAELCREAHLAGAAFVFWVQDVYSVAIRRTLGQRFGIAGRIAARRFERLEAATLRRSDGIVAITDDFVPLLRSWGVSADRIEVIENWAPLDSVMPGSQDNPWAREHGLVGRRAYLYSGTLGLKHDPSLLVDLARQAPDAIVVVISEGPGADWLRERSTVRNLTVLPFQPFERISEVLATGDVLVAILEADAGSFSVPSKVLTSLAAGRPILASIPGANLAARTIRRANAGVIVEPGDREAFVREGIALMHDEQRRSAAGIAGRRYAEAAFDISAIADRFVAVAARASLTRGTARPGSTSSGGLGSGPRT